MRLPKDILSGTYTRPKLFLCEVDKTKICQLETLEMKASLKFNAYSELSFTVSRTYTSMATGQTEINPFFDKIEALRLLYLDGFGYFEIQDPEVVSDGIREVKNITAYSLEYTLSQKYLEGFNINTGENNSLEVVYANGGLIVPITLYNEGNPQLSLLNLILEKVYGWSIGHVDNSLKTMGRMFEISRVSVYDFIMQDICEKFNCFAVFDTINNTINLYAESLISKHIGDGKTRSFTVLPVYEVLDTVSIDSYKTTAYVYDNLTGVITFDTAPENGARIEIVDGSQSKWKTDVYASFENLAKEVNISYSADDIKTVLTVKGADDLDIREVNMGLPYIVDISYYYNVDWMGQDLFDAYTLYLQKCNSVQSKYIENAEVMLDITNRITYEEQRLSLQYSIADHVGPTTVGTYYVRGGSYPNYYYTEVKLPDDYSAEIEHYYTLSDNDLTETKVANLYDALQSYFMSKEDKDVKAIDELKDSFAFMNVYTIEYLSNSLSNATSLNNKDTAIINFLDEMWNQIGKTPLDLLYLKAYKQRESAGIEAGWNDPDNANYWMYYPVTLFLKTIETAISKREATIANYQEQYKNVKNENIEIAESVLIDNNFTKQQLVRLSAFLREDEYTDDNFIETESDTIETIMRTKKELLECGRIELSKLCEPKLEFSMDMSNIYAMPEFEPIINQFQLGNLINVVIRSDYIKRARLLAVDINFDDFSDFSCEFGELTNLRTPSSIHADLLASALSAGKSVASNASYWNKGSDAATSLSLLIQQGLLDAATVIKAIDGNQGVSIDQYGIHLQKINAETGEIDQKEGWIVNNQFLYSDDNFKTTKSVFGEYTVGGQNKWGLLAEAIMAGYVAGCTIEGGTINIGEGTFVVDSNGAVIMKASSIDGYVEEDSVISAINQSAEKISINANKISLAGKQINLTSDNTTISSTNFSVDKDGKVIAKSGQIGGWTIVSHKIQGTTESGKVAVMQAPSDGITFVFAAGGTSHDSYASCPFRVTKDGKLYATDADIKGTITATSGTIGGCSINNGVLNVSAANITSGTIDSARISNLSADKITTGTIHVDRIPSLNADKITAGTIHVDRIPSLSADKITVGTLSADRIPNISASKITTGTLSADRLSSSVITTGNFSSKSLSTSYLTIKAGCIIGSTTYNADIDSRSGYAFISADGPTRYGTTIYELVKSATASSSNKDIKHDIHDFDERYNVFFDKLNPQLFKYNFEPDDGYTMGYIWQEVEEALNGSNLTRNDVGAIYESEAVNGGLGLRKSDFIALNTWQIQKLKARVEELENKLAALEA